MTDTQLIIVALIVPIVAFFGNLLMLGLQRLTKLQTKWMLIICLFALALLMAYGMIGLAPNATFGIVSIVSH
jgi:MFS-type transporter involved in bile tolerance (Atg22 family)